MKICSSCRRRFDSDHWRCPNCGHSPQLYHGYMAFAPEQLQTVQVFDADYFPRLFALEESNFWFRSRNRLIAWALEYHFPHARTLLEIGCGTGYVLSGIHQRKGSLKLWGGDIYTEGLDYARKRVPQATFLQMDASNIPFEDEFDVIGAFDVLEHSDEDHRILQEMFKATTPGGGILLTVPQHQWLWSSQDEMAFHKRRYSQADLAIKVRKAGFTIRRMTSFISLLFPLMVISRMISRRQKSEETGDDELRSLKIHPIMNIIFEKICTVERGLIRRSVPFPMGGSLLCIAVKE